MAKYPDDFKDYLKETARVHEVIQSITGTVRPSGRHYVALCPFHGDTDPSLFIHGDKNTWSCLSCGAGSRNHSYIRSSDVYGFIKGYYKCNLGEAIEWLAKFLHVPLPPLTPEQQYQQSRYDWWVKKCEATLQRFQQNLLKNPDAYKYLLDRNISDTEIITWGLGFGDGEEQDFMNTKGKISFAIHDAHGRIISFTGRVPFGATALAMLNEKEKLEGKRVTPKYDHRWKLTTDYVDAQYLQQHPFPEFHRNEYLYGYVQAKEYIRQSGRAILVEGFTDVITMHKYGQCNTVATLGTNLSPHHIELLKRAGAKRVLLMRDGDKAGLTSMTNDARALEPHGLIVEVCPLPEGHDPDSWAQIYSPISDEFAKHINKRTRSLVQWRVEQVYREQQDEILYHYAQIGEIQGHRMQRVVEYIAQEPDVIQRDILLRQYAELFVISYESLKEKVEYYLKKGDEHVGQNRYSSSYDYQRI